ncbi:glycosyltransferase family 2 protein [Lutibacter sp.]
MQTPLVSIIIPTYNRAHLIGETLDSILAQTYTNWECIVVDDGSTDNTDSLLAAYCAKDKRFQYHHRPSDRPKGANACRNYGFELSKGEYINWFDSDDLFSNNKIEEQINGLVNSGYDIATCKWGKFNTLEKIKIKELFIYKHYQNGLDLLKDYGEQNSFFPSHTFLLKKEIIFKSGLWNEALKINQDGEFFCRVLIKAKNIFFAQYCYILYRNPFQENTSSLQNINKARHLILSWKLISLNLELIHNNEFEKYLNNAKDYIYIKLKKDYKNIIKENKDFFKNQIKKQSFFNRLKRKLF